MSRYIDYMLIARRDGSLSYIQVAYSVADADKMEQEISSFYTIADGYEKILITIRRTVHQVASSSFQLFTCYVIIFV